MNKKHLQRC